MNIDWSKAPEGATHYSEHEGARNKWLKVKSSGSAFHHDGNCWIRYPDGSPFREGHLRGAIARPEIAEWNGEGLPPVGAAVDVKCLAKTKARDWFPAEVLYISPYTVVLKDYSTEELDGEFVAHPSTLSFQPRRTPEQIAADEREKAVNELAAELAGHWSEEAVGPQRALAAYLHDIGYRKQVKP